MRYLVIGVDLDGTLAQYTEFNGAEHIGPLNPNMARLIRSIAEQGHTVCLWTTRATYLVRKWLKANELDDVVSYVNDSPYPTDDRKCSFDFYIGDEAITYRGDSDAVLRELTRHPHWAPVFGVPDSNFEPDRAFANRSPQLYFKGVGRRYVDMFETEYRKLWADRKLQRRAFLTICSHAKPYSKSYIHTSIRRALHQRSFLNDTDYIHISNAGLIPSEAETDHPFCAYDWDGSECSVEDVRYHKAAMERRLHDWFIEYGRHYERIVCYLRAGGNTGTVMQHIAERYRVELVLAVPVESPDYMALPDLDDCLADPANLQTLKDSL
jgi:hypothetical protein